MDQETGKDLNPNVNWMLGGGEVKEEGSARNPDRCVCVCVCLSMMSFWDCVCVFAYLYCSNFSLPHRPSNLAPVVMEDDKVSGRGTTRITSPEKWEIKQLIAAGVLDKSDYPGFNEETGVLPADDDPGSDEDVEVELVEDEPVFLHGQTRLSVHHSPVKIVKVRYEWN